MLAVDSSGVADTSLPTKCILISWMYLVHHF